MKDHTDCRRAFHWSTKAWYQLPGSAQEINFGMYHLEGGTTGEMSMRWVDLGNEFSPQLRVFCDAWHALSLFPDLVEILGQHDDENITQEQFVEILLQCGFEDLTAYESPYTSKESELRLELAAIEKRRDEIKALLREKT